jgi:cell division cycle protein 37
MINADARATSVFLKDVEDTYAHLVERVRVSKLEDQETAAAAEQIQLVPENPDATIGFNVPDGPPPEHITLEGPGTEGMNIEDVRKALQLQWEVYDGFSPEMQEALKSQSLESVNKVLGAMKVAEAERVVELLQMSGILSFADGGIRDETGQGEEEETEEEDAVEDA